MLLLQVTLHSFLPCYISLYDKFLFFQLISLSKLFYYFLVLLLQVTLHSILPCYISLYDKFLFFFFSIDFPIKIILAFLGSPSPSHTPLYLALLHFTIWQIPVFFFKLFPYQNYFVISWCSYTTLYLALLHFTIWQIPVFFSSYFPIKIILSFLGAPALHSILPCYISLYENTEWSVQLMQFFAMTLSSGSKYGNLWI